jgi:broad specificity phosphatase PhoE
LQSTAGAPPRQILLIRHGEKPPPSGPPPAGIKDDGREDDHSLVVRGWQRAGALAHFFRVPSDPAILTPDSIYAPPLKGGDGDHGRPHQTVMPLAQRLGLEIDARFGLEEETELVADLRARRGVVLISWEHNRIPKIANVILGDDTTAPQQWPDERFDLVWVFDRQPGGDYTFSQRPQFVLSGDRPDIVPKG